LGEPESQDEDRQDSEHGEAQPQGKSGRKRTSSKAGLLANEKEIKSLKRKHAGSMFASAEDFAHLLSEDAK